MTAAAPPRPQAAPSVLTAAAPLATPVPLWTLLGVPATADRAAVDAAYLAARGQGSCAAAGAGPAVAGDSMRAVVRRAWRLLRDPFYGPLYRHTGSLAAVVDAGWFDDGTEPETLPDHRDTGAGEPLWWATPVGKVAARVRALAAAGQLTAGRELVVLLTTGAFAPVHDGHLAMLERARTAVQARGALVVGGFLAPDHDAYVAAKLTARPVPCGPGAPVQTPGGRCGPVALTAEDRLRMCQVAVADSDWLAVDPWTARCLDRQVNFTDVVVHLERVLAMTVAPLLPAGLTLRVGYVFGADNVDFARAFTARGLGVCVARPGAEAAVAAARACPQLAALAAQGRVVLAYGGLPVSSTALRAGASTQTPPAVLAAWGEFHDAAVAPRPRAGVYAVRDDLAWGMSPWLVGAPADAGALAAAGAFRVGLIGALDAALAAGSGAAEVRLLDVAAQVRAVEDLQRRRPVLSLDVVAAGTARLDVSRSFDVADAQLVAGPVVARPGTAALERQVAAVPAGGYVLVDDDVASGATLAAVRALLPPQVVIEDVRTLLRVSLQAAGLDEGDVVDVVDARDFLPGARAAGLVVTLPDGTLARAPYLWPYVDLPSRASLPAAAARRFSHAVWSLAADLYAAAAPQLRVADVDPAFGALMRAVGFARDAWMSAVCAWHATHLES